MSPVDAVMRRELRSYFITPQGYLLLILFLLLANVFTFYLGDFYARGQADLLPFFDAQPWLYLIITPIVTMRWWAEEEKSGHLELLLTLPLQPAQAMLGKFLAGWVFLGMGLTLTFPIWLTVNYLGSPDNGVIALGYLGSWLMAGVFLAIGACLSTFTQSQVTACILSLIMCCALVLTGLPKVQDFFQGMLPSWLILGLGQLSMVRHFTPLAHGVLGLHDLLYFILSIVCWLGEGVTVLQWKRAG